MNNYLSLSETRIKRLRAQGYTTQTEAELNELAFGIRFPYRMCVAVLSIAVATANIPLLAAMMVLSFMSVLLPNHPFDYLYNHVVRKWVNKPALGPRSPQLTFACSIATVWLGATTWLFYAGVPVGGYVLGIMLIATASLPAFTDFCVPSFIYNALFNKKTIKSKAIIS